MNDFYPPLRRILIESGCSLIRKGKGDHEIWSSPQSANAILKQAGLKKVF
jgi:hypothetical protein